MGEQMFLGIKLPQRHPLHGLSRAGYHQPAAAEVSEAAGSEVTVLSPPLNLACVGLWLTIAPPPPSFLSLLKDGLLTQELENQRQTLWAPGKRLEHKAPALCPEAQTRLRKGTTGLSRGCQLLGPQPLGPPL